VYGVFPFAASYLVTRATTRPAERDLTSTPADSGVEYRDVEFVTTDNVRLSGWFMPSHGGNVTIVFSHGLFRSRHELLERAVDLWRLGYGILLYDARNHGKSGQARVTLGYDERLDAEAAVKFLRDDLHTRDQIVLYGISMGAVASLMAAAETPEVGAVIADSPFLTLDDTIDHHVRLITRLPAFPLAYELKRLLEWRTGVDTSKLDALDAARRLHGMPAMFIAGAHDPRMPPDVARQLASINNYNTLVIIDGPGDNVHGHAFDADSQRYIREITEFLLKAFPTLN
jgi:pimeloyl-ACP methyl ester carboxylesterase